MYRSHFGLNQSPFGITPNPAFFYSGSNRGDILEALIYAVTHGEGIIKVTGEVGSGKTMLCRMLESMMPANVEVIYLVNPTLSREEVMFTIAGELGLATGGKRPDEVIRLLHTDLITKHVTGKQVVLLVEEAQAMPLETLEEIRLFSNLETAHHKLLQIVLFGQPELDENLNLPRMRQLKERITHSFKVPPLAPEVIPEFLMFRLQAAGYTGPDMFSKGAIKLLATVSKGIVRRINILADKSMLAAFAEGAHSIQTKHLKAAVRDSEFTERRAPHPQRNLMIGFAVSVAVVIAADIGLRIYWPNIGGSPQSKSTSTPAAKAPSARPATVIAQAPRPIPPVVPVAPAQIAPVNSVAPLTATPAAVVPVAVVPVAVVPVAVTPAPAALAKAAAPLPPPAPATPPVPVPIAAVPAVATVTPVTPVATAAKTTVAPAPVIPAKPVATLAVAPPVARPVPANAVATVATIAKTAAASPVTAPSTTLAAKAPTPTTPPSPAPVVAAAATPAKSIAAPVVPAPAPQAASTLSAPAGSILRQRVAASKIWIRDGTNDQSTIQLNLIDAGDLTEIERFLKKAGAELGVEHLYLYPTRIGTNSRFGIMYSSFATREEARLARIGLASKWGDHSQLRTIGGIRTEMLRTQSDALWPK